MALSTKRRDLDATGRKVQGAALYQAIESYAGNTDGARRGEKQRGSHAKVQARPHFWAPAELSDDEVHQLRVALAGGEQFLAH